MDHHKRQEQLAHMPIGLLFWKFSLPAIVGMLVQALYNIVDRIFIGRIAEVGAIAIGGIGVTMPITFVFLGTSMLFGIGAGANISIKLGQRDKTTAEKILVTAVLINILTAIVLAIVVLSNTEGLLKLFGATAENIKYASTYLRIIAIGNIWNTVSFALTHVIRAEGNPVRSMVAMFIGAGVNVILDPIFIFTFDMGVAGAAYATIISQALSLLWSAAYYTQGKSHLKFSLKYFSPTRDILLMITKIGVSPFFLQISSSLVGAIFNNVLKEYGGALAQSTYISINTISMLFFMPVFGMNQGTQPIVGFNYGAKNYARARKAGMTSLFYATLVVTIGWILTRVAPGLLASLLTNDPKLIDMVSKTLPLAEMLMFTVGIQVVAGNFFQSIGKAGLSFFMTLLRTLIVLVPLLLILPGYYGLNGAWMAIPITDVVASSLAGIFFYREFRRLAKLEEQKNLDWH